MAVIDCPLSKESQERYLTYALSVVSSRALPDVRDGLKPVQRRILYAMFKNLRLQPGSSYRKSAAVVGDVLAHFHPHGDVACYEAMVRMAQDFSLRYPLVDGQGNFGSLDGDSAAAYRYTEARLRALAIEVIGEIDQETVGFRDNFDATVVEPIVFPSRVPNLLINGATGIAVGMATSIPPHNLRDTVKALLELLENPEATNSQLVSLLKAPDFPTGCQILNTRKELNDMYATGRGTVRMRGEWAVEELGRGKQAIVITAIPYAVNKSQLVEKIANLIIERKVPQLSDIRDESTDTVRIVLELSSGASAEAAMAYLFRHTPVESNFSMNLTALVPVQGNSGGACRPELLSLRDCLRHFLSFREEVTRKRLEFERRTLLDRIHILEGLILIFDALDEAIKIVRKSDGRSDAAEKLRARFKLSEVQAFAVVDMRIYQLSRTNISEVRAERDAKQARVGEIDRILKSKARITQIIKEELQSLDEQFGDKRLCRLVKENVELEFDEEAYVVNEDVYAIVTADGWIKRVRQTNDVSTTRIREGDRILSVHALSTRDQVAFFTNFGTLYALRVTDFSSSSGYGTPIQKSLRFRDGEKVVATFGVRSAATTQQSAQASLLAPASELDADRLLAEGTEMLLVSTRGVGFALKVTGLADLKRSGKRAMKLREGDSLANVVPLRKWVGLFTRHASGLVISSKDIPQKESAVIGVQLIGVRDDDAVVGVVTFDRPCTLSVTLDSGRLKEIESATVTSGHRALKGTKIVAKGEVITVTRHRPQPSPSKSDS